MFPVSFLPIAGLLLGIGASLSNTTMISSYGLEWLLGDGTILNFILVIMKSAGSIIFTNLPLIFAIGVAIGMSDQEKGVAAMSAVIGFLSMHATISALLSLTGKLDYGRMLPGTLANVCGIKSLEMGVFGGIIVGIGVASLHNKYYKIKLPDVISFFGGVRFIPIISSTVYIFVGALMFFIWPQIQFGMSVLGNIVAASHYAGTFVYGVIERALIPFGLHHVFYMPFWQTGIGGSAFVDNKYITGAQNIFFAELASQTTEHFSVIATRFMTGKFPFMIFGLPAAALAMYNTAKPEKKKVISGLLLSAAITSMLTGITEPLEFTFLFVAPVLYGIHCVFAGISFMVMHILNVAVGMTFSGGVIDLILFGVMQGNEKTNWIYIIFVGIIYAVLYYFVFRYAILKFNLITPGRESDGLESKLYTRKDYEEAKNLDNKSQANTSQMIIEGLGGEENIEVIECCATRLRVKVFDASKVIGDILKESGAAGVIVKGNGVQVVYGPKVTVIKSELCDYLVSIGSKISI